MQLNLGQQAALEAMLGYRDTNTPFKCVGNAGTGKTTLICEFIKRLHGTGRIYLCAPTNKAVARVASLVQRAGIRMTNEPTTIHALCLQPVARCDPTKWALFERALAVFEADPTEANLVKMEAAEKAFNKSKRVEFLPRSQPLEEGSTVIIDEASMVGEKTWSEAVDNVAGCRVFVFGDDGQLPPVKDIPAFDLSTPHARLTKVERQGEGSGILALATHFRTGGSIADIPAEILASPEVELIDAGTCDGAARVPWSYGPEHKALTHDHVSRRTFNIMARHELGLLTLLSKGEEVIAHGRFNDMFRNGYVTTVAADYEDVGALNHGIALDGIDGKEFKVTINEIVKKSSGSPKITELFANLPVRGERHALEHAYAMTVHSSQGSEFDEVTLVVPTYQLDDADKWLYTGVTRARKKVRIVLNFNASLWREAATDVKEAA